VLSKDSNRKANSRLRDFSGRAWQEPTVSVITYRLTPCSTWWCCTRSDHNILAGLKSHLRRHPTGKKSTLRSRACVPTTPPSPPMAPLTGQLHLVHHAVLPRVERRPLVAHGHRAVSAATRHHRLPRADRLLHVEVHVPRPQRLTRRGQPVTRHAAEAVGDASAGACRAGGQCNRTPCKLQPLCWAC
jgi:hypothetical protein